MKRNWFVVLALVVSLALVGGVAASGVQALPGSGWWTSFQVQNVGTGQASVQVTAYHEQGGATDTHSASVTLAVNEAQTFIPGGSGWPGVFDVTPGLEAGFAGSTVLSSDQPIVAIAQVGNNQVSPPGGTLGVSGGNASAQYRGVGNPDTTISYPLVKHNWASKTTTFYVQAAGGAASVTATYKMNDGSTKTDGPHAIDANKSYVFDPAAASVASSGCGSDANTSPCVGSVSFASTSGSLAGTVIEHQHTASPATLAQSTNTFASSDQDKTLNCPTFKNDWVGRTTGLTVQNAGGTAATVSIEIKTAAGTGAPATYNATSPSVAAGASYTFYPGLGNVGGMPASSYGAVKVTSLNNIVAIVNEAGGSPTKATTYSCFANSSATTKIALPQVKEGFAGSTTGVTIQNVGASTTNVDATYSCGGTNYTHATVNIGAGSGKTFWRHSASGANWTGTPLPDNKNCSVVVTSDSQNVVAIAQEAAYPSGSLDTKNYEGFNLTP